MWRVCYSAPNIQYIIPVMKAKWNKYDYLVWLMTIDVLFKCNIINVCEKREK